MSKPKILIDTNIIVGLEDAGQIQASFADLVKKANKHGLQIFVHEASKRDIANDKDEARKKSTLSKIRKFSILEKVAVPAASVLEGRFGKLPKQNDVVDATLLDAVDAGLVDFLVSQDGGLHKRARNAGIENSVFTVGDALGWIEQSYEPAQVALPAVEDMQAYSLDEQDPIFDSLRGDYSGFNAWLQRCKREHRNCWVIKEQNKLAGIVIYKDESHAEADTQYSGSKIMKLSTFKVSDAFSGNKYGELLLKKAIWSAQRGKYDLVYVTAFAKQQRLIELFESYGFQHTKTRTNEEQVFEKPLGRGVVKLRVGQAPLDAARQHYPRFFDGPSVRKFLIPIRPEYHRKLFPELDGVGQSGKPGNTIRKVYLCRSPNKQLRPGDILIFYRSNGPGLNAQSLTSIGIIENVRQSKKVVEVTKWTAKRSVFSAGELASLVQARPSALKVIDFLLVGHVTPAVTLAQLLSKRIVSSWPQSITGVDEAKYLKLKPLLRLNFDL